MEVGEILLTPADDGGIDDAVADHLDGAEKCDQRGRAGRGDGIAGPHESIPVADEAGRRAVDSPQECGVIRGHASGLHLPYDCALLVRGEVNGSFDGGEDVVNVSPDDDIGKGSRRLSRVLGDDDPDPLGRDVRLQDAGCPDSLLRQPHGVLCGGCHGPEILGGNPEFIAGDMEVQEGAHLAVGLVRNERPGIIKDTRDPTGKAEPG